MPRPKISNMVIYSTIMLNDKPVLQVPEPPFDWYKVGYYVAMFFLCTLWGFGLFLMTGGLK